MDIDETGMRELFTEASRDHTLAASHQVIAQRIVRRRRRTAVAYSAAALGVVACALVGVSQMQARTPATDTPVGLAGTRSAPTPSPDGSYPTSQLLAREHTFRCGQAVEGPLQTVSAFGVRVAVHDANISPTGAQAIITISLDHDGEVSGPAGATSPRLLILRDGLIIGGQDLPVLPPPSSTPGHPVDLGPGVQAGRLLKITKAQPYQEVLTLTSSQLCQPVTGHRGPPPLTWQQLRSAPNPGHYTLRVVMSADYLRPDLNQRVPNWRNDPLLCAETPLPPASSR